MATQEPYDGIVIGGRCAGAPAAMLLARLGYRVLLVDRAHFPSDTVSTHLIHPPGVDALRRWGVLDRVVATGCPAIDTYVFDFGAVRLAGAPGTDASPVGYAPRRTILDEILLDAARDVGVEVREGFAVEGLLMEDGVVVGIRGHTARGPTITERARLVIGADGLHSHVARAVNAEAYNEKPPLNCCYYGYWSGLPTNGCFETFVRPDRGFAAWPTNDELTLVVFAWPFAEYSTIKHDPERHLRDAVELAPAFAERFRGATRTEHLRGSFVHNYFRKPFGPGWALIGDAGYNKDYVTAQGIQDAFRDAELCVSAIDRVFSGTTSFDDAMREYQTTRDEHVLAMFELTLDFATLAAPPPDRQELFAAMQGNQSAMDGFGRVMAGVTSPSEFFSQANIANIFAARAATSAVQAEPARPLRR